MRTSPTSASRSPRASSGTRRRSTSGVPGAFAADIPPASERETTVARPSTFESESARVATASMSSDAGTTKAARSSPRSRSTRASMPGSASMRSASLHSALPETTSSAAMAATRGLDFSTSASTARSAASVAWADESLSRATDSSLRASASTFCPVAMAATNFSDAALSAARSASTEPLRVVRSETASLAVLSVSSICSRREAYIRSSTSALEIWSSSLAYASVSRSASARAARSSAVILESSASRARRRVTASRETVESSSQFTRSSFSRTTRSASSSATRERSALTSARCFSIVESCIRMSERRETMFLPFSSRRRMSASMRPRMSCMRRRCSPRSPTKRPFCSRRDWSLSSSRAFSS